MRKPTPSPPNWYFWDNDCCWFCRFRIKQNACTNCSIIKKSLEEQGQLKKRDAINNIREKEERKLNEC